jgi:hypothetical protein
MNEQMMTSLTSLAEKLNVGVDKLYDVMLS